MPLILEVSPEVEARLREVARARGTDVSDYVSQIVLQIERLESDATLTLSEAALILKTTPELVRRMLARGELNSLHAFAVLSEVRRRDAANQALDEIVEITESLNLYEHQRETA